VSFKYIAGVKTGSKQEPHKKRLLILFGIGFSPVCFEDKTREDRSPL